MLLQLSHDNSYSRYADRRKKLLDLVRKEYNANQGLIIVFAGFETSHTTFRQESSFLYLTGLNEPGLVLTIDFSGIATLYTPNYKTKREQWAIVPSELVQRNAKALEVDRVESLGGDCASYQIYPFSPVSCWNAITQQIANTIQDGGQIYSVNSVLPDVCIEQRVVLDRLCMASGWDKNAITIDLLPFIAHMRRVKDMSEIEHMHEAARITAAAQRAAAEAIQAGEPECMVRANLEWIMTAAQSRPAFASIVAAGKNSTILHYTNCDAVMKTGDLVVVDIGAEVHGYCADVTRTYPVSGSFSPRQYEIYSIVLEAQKYAETIAKPGMWLSNVQQQEQSVNHLVRQFFAHKGLDKYFAHNIGHFLGLDVHDVSDGRPLQEGDVLTIEPGLYIPEEEIGVRIEDDYWMTGGGVVCLSDEVPKKPQEIEALMVGKISEKIREDMH